MSDERDDARILADALKGYDGDLVALHIATRGHLLTVGPGGEPLRMETEAQRIEANFAKQILDDLGFTLRVGRKPEVKETQD